MRALVIISFLALYANISSCEPTQDGRDLQLSEVKFRTDSLQEAVTRLSSESASARCYNDTTELLRAATRGERWANQMLDSWAKASAGSLYGSRFQLGNFDECLGACPDHLSCKVLPRYCLVHVDAQKQSSVKPRDRIEQPIWPERQELWSAVSPLMWAACLPASCSDEDATFLISKALQPKTGPTGIPLASENFTIDVNVSLTSYHCQDESPLPLQLLDHAFLVLIAFSMSIVAMATVYDVLIHKGQTDKESSTTSAVLRAFSVSSNLSKLVKWSPSELNLDCVIGIKFYCMLLIIAGHGVVFLVTGPVGNAEYVHEAVQQVQNGYLLNGMLFVDSFLVVSGFLLTRLLLIELDKKRSVNLGLLYLFRYIRLTPAYFVVIFLYCTLLPRLGSGPLWKARTYLERDRCQTSWWANLLYINNYVTTDQLSWYIAADTQLFMLAPLLIIPLWRWPRVGLWLVGGVACGSIAVPFFLTWLQRLDPVLLIHPWEMPMGDLSGNSMYQAAIIRTHMRACSYVAGLVLGWIVHQWQKDDNTRTLSPVILRTGSWLAILAAVGSLFSVAVFYKDDHSYSPIEAAVYAALHRLAWACATSWLIFACVTGNGGFAQKVLTWRPIIPLSRLTYCAYLANGVVVLRASATIRSPRHLNTYELMMEVVSQIFATFCAGLILSLLFESPIHGIERMLLQKVRPRETTNATAKPSTSQSAEQPQHMQQATSQL